MNNEAMNTIFIVMKLSCLPQFKGKLQESGIDKIDSTEKLCEFLEKHNLVEMAMERLKRVQK
jgi:hypothetical protein